MEKSSLEGNLLLLQLNFYNIYYTFENCFHSNAASTFESTLDRT